MGYFCNAYSGSTIVHHCHYPWLFRYLQDIAALVEYGLDIVTIHSTQSKYFVASRRFELPELKLLIDAVESSKFITKKKSDALIEKIHTLTSSGQVSKLKRNIYIADRIKPDNEQIYYIVDTINDAINEGRQIAFQYYDYTGHSA